VANYSSFDEVEVNNVNNALLCSLSIECTIELEGVGLSSIPNSLAIIHKDRECRDEMVVAYASQQAENANNANQQQSSNSDSDADDTVSSTTPSPHAFAAGRKDYIEIIGMKNPSERKNVISTESRTNEHGLTGNVDTVLYSFETLFGAAPSKQGPYKVCWGFTGSVRGNHNYESM
jgi:hypothetical protein